MYKILAIDYIKEYVENVKKFALAEYNEELTIPSRVDFTDKRISADLTPYIWSGGYSLDDQDVKEKTEVHSLLNKKNKDISWFVARKNIFHDESAELGVCDGDLKLSGPGFLLFKGCKGDVVGSGYYFCSRLTIFDPISKIAVDSHLRLNYAEVIPFIKHQLIPFINNLAQRAGLRLDSYRINVVYGVIDCDEDMWEETRPDPQCRDLSIDEIEASQIMFPGKYMAHILRQNKFPVDIVRASDSAEWSYFDLETGELTMERDLEEISIEDDLMEECTV
mgnify:CR=1 FL=1|jgi:hypothetical protein